MLQGYYQSRIKLKVGGGLVYYQFNPNLTSILLSIKNPSDGHSDQ